MYPSLPRISARGGIRAWWLSLFGLLGRDISGQARLFEQHVADRVKDFLLDLGHDPDEDDYDGGAACPLPTMDPDRFTEALRMPVDVALRRAAERLNEGPGGYTLQKIEEQVHAIFDELARPAIEEAFQQRMALAETDLPPEDGGGAWARRYRRMMAREGRWPAPSESGQLP
jgi:hypothetical protein